MLKLTSTPTQKTLTHTTEAITSPTQAKSRNPENVRKSGKSCWKI